MFGDPALRPCVRQLQVGKDRTKMYIEERPGALTDADVPRQNCYLIAFYLCLLDLSFPNWPFTSSPPFPCTCSPVCKRANVPTYLSADGVTLQTTFH
jgi:hypothetical protein